MNEKDWYECGAKIGDLVQSAIDSKNFQQLNKAITDTINQTVDSVQESLYRDAKKGAGQNGFSYRPTHREKGNAYEQARSRAGAGDLFDAFTGRGSRGGAVESGNVNKSLKGVFSMVAGYGMAVISAIAAVVMLFLSWFTGFSGFGFSFIFFAALAAIFAFVGARGGGYQSRLKQVERYLQIMGDRDTITVKELAAASGKSEKAVKKELKEMISDGMFAGGAYMDDQDTTLMTSQEAWRQYQETMRAYEERKAAAEREAAYQSRYTQGAPGEAQGSDQAGTQANISEETAGILREGREFINHIHACNDAIPGEEMTQKLSHLEQVVTRIFEQVERDPNSAPDLHRMMSYYLPITRKLVDAYVDLGASGIGGENINKTRKEIEMSLDTINTAFETLLDSFYQDTAWDISSDISAMKTMMARDGLTGGGDFQRTREVAGDLGSAGVSSGSASGQAPSAASETAAPAEGQQAAQAAGGAAQAGTGAAVSAGGGAAAAMMMEE